MEEHLICQGNYITNTLRQEGFDTGDGKHVKKGDYRMSRTPMIICAWLTCTTKMKGDNFFHKIQSGDYRIIYEIQNDRLVILVIKIGHRKDVYKELVSFRLVIHPF